MRNWSVFLIASTLLSHGSAQAQVLYDGLKTDIVMNGPEDVFQVQNLRCHKLTINGAVKLVSAAQADIFGPPKTASIACDEIVFTPNAEFDLYSNLTMWGGVIDGQIKLNGLRNRKGVDKVNIKDRAADGNPGQPGSLGPNGDDAHGPGYSAEYPGGKGSSAGGDGGIGTHGTNGLDGKDGDKGATGETNVSIVVNLTRFGPNAGCPEVMLRGGGGGHGGNGQPGGNGGPGGPGGAGGKGGDAALGHSGSPGGNGGHGGDGGNAGNGGRGGNGGKGGDGGRIEIIVDEAGFNTVPSCLNLSTSLENHGGDGGYPGIGGAAGGYGVGGTGGAFGSGGADSNWAGVIRNDGGRKGYDGDRGTDGMPGKVGENGDFGPPGIKGETHENLFGHAKISNPTTVDWNHVNN